MLPAVSVEQMRDLERATEALGLPGPALMENAGRACAEAIRNHFPIERSRRILVLVGPGNNGGDGLVVARHLHDCDRDVAVYQVGRQPVEDAKILLLRERDVPIYSASDDPDFRTLDAVINSSDLLVDALLGAGQLRPIVGPLATVMDRVNARTNPGRVVAVDLPSGVNANSGAADPHAVRADLTVTLGFPKRGLFIGRAAQLVGELAVVDIGIPRSLARDLDTLVADRASIVSMLPQRPRVSHKGSFGKVMIVAGSLLYTGAPVLAALGAERVGAGLVTLACPARIRDSLAVHTVETTFLPVPDGDTGELTPAAVAPLLEALPGYNGVLVGPGIGRSPATAEFLFAFLHGVKQAGIPTVIDADGLTLLSGQESWWELLPPNTILTPHPGEMARLTHQPEQDDRIEVARRSATTWTCTVVLKGAYSIVARQDGRVGLLPFANPALATAGTGDVLGGAILGMIAQGLAAPSAALVGAFLHGVAGQLLFDDMGPAGGLAGELSQRLPNASRLVRESRDRSLSVGYREW